MHPRRPMSPPVCWALAGILGIILAGCDRTERARQQITKVGEIRALRGAPGRIPVRLRGHVTYNDGPMSLMFLEDATGGVRIENWALAGNIAVSQNVEVVGTVGNTGYQPSITASQVTPIPGALDNSSVPASFSELGNPNLQYRRVEVKGVVRSADLDNRGMVGILLQMPGGTVRARVRESLGDYRALVDAEIVVHGVLSTSRDAEDRPGQPTLWVETIDNISIARAAPVPASIPARTVLSLLAMSGADLPVHRVRLHGAIVAERNGTVLRDGTGEIPVRADIDTPSPATAAEADWTGFVVDEQGRRLLADCLPAAKAESELAPVTLTSAKQVHSLPVELAGRSYPVSFDAVVTYSDEESRNLFVQDDTDGIYANMWAVSAALPKAGERVHVSGFSGPGDIAPVIAHPRLDPLGPGQMPEPFAGDMEQLLAGAPESKWVEARGVVRSIGFDGDHAALLVGWGIHRFRVSVSAVNRGLPDFHVGSRIRLQGVCGARFNSKRQLLGIQIFVPGPEYLFLDSANREELPPLQSINTLLQISPPTRRRASLPFSWNR